MFGFAGFISEKTNNLSAMLDYTSNYKQGNVYSYQNGNCTLGIKQMSEKFGDNNVTFAGCEGYSIAFNGRIYNALDLKSRLDMDVSTDSCAEIVVIGYKKIGKDIFKELKGMFALAIYDEENGELVLSRDGCGMRSVYYYQNGKTFAFASNTKAFLGLDGFKKELNTSALSPFLCFGSVPTEETLVKNVYRLEAGHVLSFKNGEISKECFFKLDFNIKNKPIDEFCEDIHKVCVSSINAHANGNYATFLSSGVDSSYIASVAKPKITYTAGYTDQKYDESVYTKELANILGIENRVKTVSPEEYLKEYENVVSAMDEPLSNPSVSSIYFGVQAAKETADIIISGEGADELFGGYNSYKEEISHSGYMKIPYFVRHLVYLCTKWIPSNKFDFFARRGQNLKDYHIGLDRVFKDKDAKNLLKTEIDIKSTDVTAKYYDYYKDCSTMQQRQAIDFYFWLINDFVHCVTKSAEFFGMESRFPLLSKDIIDVAVTLPDEYKLRDGMTKAAFRMSAKKVIPNDAHSRKKLGFPVPLKEWIKRDDFYEEIKSKFQSEAANKFFNANALLKMLDDHKKGVADYYKKIWTIYTFIIWYQLNF